MHRNGKIFYKMPNWLCLSAGVKDPGSIRVTDYGRDGPIVFLVKSAYSSAEQQQRSSLPQTVARVEGSLLRSPQPQLSDSDDEAAATQLRIMIPSLSVDARVSRSQRNMAESARRDWLAEGNLAYEREDYEEALRAYEEASTQDVVSVEAWSGKAATLLCLGRVEEALLAYDHAISLYPKDPELWTARANVLHEL